MMSRPRMHSLSPKSQELHNEEETKMKPSQLKELLGKTIPAGLPVLVTGAPGIGKSDIVHQAAEDADADIIISHPAVADPTDAKGLPWIGADKKSATFLPFGEMARALKAEKLTVWFLDDLGQAPPAVQASFMQLLLARRVNGHMLPDCVTFVAATNRRTDRAGVSGILEPVKSRFAAIVELTVDMDEWSQWAINAGLPPELIAFIRFRPELLCKFTPSADLTNCPLPRTWAFAAKAMALGLSQTVLSQTVAGAVGEGAASEFIAFLRMYQELPSIDGILVDPDKGAIPEQPAVLYAVVTALGMRSNPQNFGRIARYAERLADAGRGEFSALLVRDAVRRDSKICQTTAFVKLASGPVGTLISGSVS